MDFWGPKKSARKSAIVLRDTAVPLAPGLLLAIKVVAAAAAVFLRLEPTSVAPTGRPRRFGPPNAVAFDVILVVAGLRVGVVLLLVALVTVASSISRSSSSISTTAPVALLLISFGAVVDDAGIATGRPRAFGVRTGKLAKEEEIGEEEGRICTLL